MAGRLSGRAARVAKVLAFALVVHVFVLPQIGGARRALGVLGSVNGLLLALVVALEMASLLAYARLNQLLIPARWRPSLAVSFGTVLASTGVNHVVPGGPAATAAVNYRLLNGAGVPTEQIGFALGIQGLGSAVVLNLLLWGALLVSIPASGFQPIYATAAVVGTVIMAAFFGAVIGLLRGRDVVAAAVARAVGRLPHVDGDSVRTRIESVAHHLAVLVDDRRRLWTVVGLAAANWLLDAAALWVAIAAFGHRTDPAGLLVAYGLANLIAAVPVSPGGLGIVEAVLIPALVGFGAPRAVAAIGVVTYRLANFWLPIPSGAISYALVTGTRRSGGFTQEIVTQLSHNASGSGPPS